MLNPQLAKEIEQSVLKWVKEQDQHQQCDHSQSNSLSPDHVESDVIREEKDSPNSSDRSIRAEV